MLFVGSQQHVFTICNDPGCPSVMDIPRGEKTQPRMVVPGIVPGEECLTKGPGILNGTEPFGEVGSVLHGLELSFRIGIVIADRGSRMTPGDSQIGHEQGNGF